MVDQYKTKLEERVGPIDIVPNSPLADFETEVHARPGGIDYEAYLAENGSTAEDPGEIERRSIQQFEKTLAKIR
ncbi:MAG: hypothetical protein KKH52_03495 [Nanoarchaeota archaeon]|nr:hypothetical protein [Nanoarchaeota archaeon]MBU1622988.1 hypothetical protein [Nanoarchaeota archaeon]MBU1974431.1 hypothetical protein [Nanoarchaeota archaeon]